MLAQGGCWSASGDIQPMNSTPRFAFTCEQGPLLRERDVLIAAAVAHGATERQLSNPLPAPSGRGWPSQV